MVHEAIAESGERVGVVTRIARQLGIGPESPRNWVKQAEIDSGKRSGMTSAEQRRIAELERENRELFSTRLDEAVVGIAAWDLPGFRWGLLRWATLDGHQETGHRHAV